MNTEHNKMPNTTTTQQIRVQPRQPKVWKKLEPTTTSTDTNEKNMSEFPPLLN